MSFTAGLPLSGAGCSTVHGRMFIFFAVLAVLLITSFRSFAQQAQIVDLELVLALDASSSIDVGEFELQRQGLARAFLDPVVIGAIRKTGRRGIAVAVVQWAGINAQKVSVDWSIVNDAESAAVFSQKITGQSRMVKGFTDIKGVLQFATALVEANNYKGLRKVIDVSGDGSASSGDPSTARDNAVRSGVTINALVILDGSIDMDEAANNDLMHHFRDKVTGGPGSFVLPAMGFAGFADAIRDKLIREISGPLVSNVGSSHRLTGSDTIEDRTQ